ncbi:alcohol dehydrogenase-like regulatory protein ErcA [Sorangium sp. So ce1128]
MERFVRSLRKFVTPEVIFGIDARLLAGRYCKNLGAKHVLLVTDPGVLAAGWATDVAESLEKAGVAYSVFSDVRPNPTIEEVMAGTEFYQTRGCDIIVAVGGGSPTDCAKGIGIVSSNHQHILEFVGADRVSTPMPPLVAIPTTAGAASDVSQFAIITDPAARTKVAIISKAVVPDVSLVDPRTLLTMDPHLTACTGVDALSHALEAFVSRGSSPLTDIHALDAAHLVMTTLPASFRDPSDLEARTRMMLASLEAGLAFSNASLGVLHAMSHSLGGWLDLPHGACNSIVVRHVVAFNFSAAEERYVRIAEAMGLELEGLSSTEKCARLRAAIEGLCSEVGITGTLGQSGVRHSDIPELARHAMNDACIFTNPRPVDQKQVEEIYERAL